MKRSFWFHYNKPASLKAGKPQITIHYNGMCHICDHLECLAPVRDRIRKTQPVFVMAGKCSGFYIEEGTCYIK